MLGLEIQINNDTPVTVAAENFSFVLLDTADEARRHGLYLCTWT